MSLDLLTLRQANIKRSIESFHPIDRWTETDWACAAAGEMGELCNLIKKRHRGETIPLQQVADEIADCIIYLDLLAARLGFHLSGPIRDKFNRTSEKVNSRVKL